MSNSFIGASSVVSYNYDALGRVTNRAINGVSQQLAFDALHRVTVVTNVLGSFTNTYLGATMLLTTNFCPNGQKTVFSYLGVTNDERLQTIWNQNSTNGTISKFDYAYDPVGNITNWTAQADTATPTVQTMQYDPVNQLLSSTVHSNTVAGVILKQFMYGYDLSGNRTSASVGTPSGISASSATFNSANQMTTITNGGGPTQFAGSIDKQGTVTVAGGAAPMNPFTTNFVGYTSVTNGTNVIPIIATDYGNHSRTNKYQIVVINSPASQTPLYDANGSMTNDGKGISYEFDAANRTIAVNRGTTNRTEFLYDGLGRRVQIIEKTNGFAYITNKFIWCGTELCEQRDLTGSTTTKRFFGKGEQIGGTNYYFTRDHLGSVREMTDVFGAIQVRYDYDPYGNRTKVQGTMDADFGFTGHFVIASQPETTLTLYRLYRTDLGRWPNQDPIQERGGLNLYGYVGNNPINYFDLYGLSFWGRVGNGLTGAAAGAGGGALTGAGVGVVAGLGAGDWATIPAGAAAGAIAGGISGFFTGIFSDPCFNPKNAALKGAKNGALAGVTGGAAEVAGPAAGFLAGSITSATGTALDGGNSTAIGASGLFGGLLGYAGGQATGLSPFIAGTVGAETELGGQLFGAYSQVLQ